MITPQLSYERAFEPADLTEQVELFRLDANRKLDSRRRVELGQFMTPASIARLMASMLVCDTSEIALLDAAQVGLVYVTTFLTRSAMREYLADISWETEVWVAEAPSHLIHFNGERFLGPY